MAPPPQNLHTRGFQALIGPERWNALLSHGNRRTSTTTTRLLDQGAPSRIVHAIERGRVRVVYTDESGNEVLVAVRGSGDLLGEYAQWDDGEHSASVWPLEPCTVTTLEASNFAGFIERERLSDTLQRYILSKARQVGERVWRAANLPAEQRLAQLFLEVVNADPGRPSPTVPMSQRLIADSLGAGLRSVNLLVSRWKDIGLIETRPALITILDPAALSRRAHIR
ncbi:Crp/Fnr family transcriptional regulator [Glycomyces sp. NPDC048151]|uniref:Crp/Fnr family transcriptional regulator n=1 Tax=Glycomyces sp. NPDC048151 TaxID=3364002 RepID=UPI00371D6312